MNSAEPGSSAARRPVGEGRVFAPGRTGSSGLFVEIVDCLVGQDVRVGSAVTDGHGAFRADVVDTARPAPDLQARVWTSDDETAAFVGESVVAYGATAPVVRLDVEVPPDSTALESEYDALERSMRPFVNGRIADIEESDTRRDVTHLFNKTGWDARAVAMAAQADLLATESGGTISAPFFYALLRAGLPASADVLYRTEIRKVEAVWREAIDLGVVPRTAEAELPGALSAFAEESAGRMLQADPVGASSVGGLLDRTFPGDEDSKRAFARLHVAMPEGGGPFWEQVESSFGPENSRRLRLDGRLGVLTVNNAPLIKALHAAEEQNPDGPLTVTEDLARRSYFRPERWLDLLGDTVPDGVPGTGPEERKANYADFLAAQVRLSFPTAVMAVRVSEGDLPVTAEPDVRDSVAGFLSEHVGRFEMGVEPVDRFIARNDDVTAPDDPQTLEAIRQLQRVYQLTPDDNALAVLLANGLDSATKIAGLRESEFIAARSRDLGESDARAVHARAVQISDAVANIATGFLVARRAPSLGLAAPIVATPDSSDAPAGVVAFPTLEGLFGSLNVAACEHCGSILSPAAYLVDLLHFMDLPDAVKNPLDVLMARRPDIGHLPLSCENAETVLPHIDLVNETLEHFVAHSLSLQQFVGHSTPARRTPEELLAQSEFIDDDAYEPLRNALFPPPLPFHKHLETLRALFARMGVPLADAMLTLRKNDKPENPAGYGLREIAHERIGISPPEAQLLTDSSVPLPRLLGYPDNTPAADVLEDLSSVRTWANRLALTYDEIVRVLDTRFVNPSVTLKPRIALLNVSFADLQRLKNGTLSVAQFDAMLPPGLDRSAYGGDVAAWATDEANHRRIMRLLVTVPPPPAEDGGGRAATPPFDDFRVRRAGPDPAGAALQSVDAVRLVRFVRLWRKLGWTIEQTDSALGALFPAGVEGEQGGGEPTLAGLDSGVATVLDRLGTVVAVLNRRSLNPDDHLPHLLACWADLDTYGPGSLYRRLFLTGRADTEVFADNGFGDVLRDPGQGFLLHADAVRAACNVSADGFKALVDDLGFDDGTPLTLANVSAAHRRAWLARTLGLEQREFSRLLRLTGIDPFSWDGRPQPGMTELLDRLDTLAAAGTTPTAVLAALWPAGVPAEGSQPDGTALSLLRDLRGRRSVVDAELDADESTTDDRIQTLFAARFGIEAAQAFTGLLSRSTAVEVPYRQEAPALSAAVVEAAGCRIAYDAEGGRLSYAGALHAATHGALKAVQGTPQGFGAAVDALFAVSEDRRSRDSVFAQAGRLIERSLKRYPDFEALLRGHLTSADPPAARRRTLLRDVLTTVREERRRAQALTAVVAGTGTPLALAETLLTDARAVHAPDRSDEAALTALLEAGEAGLEAETGDGTSTVYRGYLDVAETGRYRIRVHTRPDTRVKLMLDEADTKLVDEGGSFRTLNEVGLPANRLLAITLTVGAAQTEQPALEWQRAGQDWQPVPPEALYGKAAVAGLREILARYLAARDVAQEFSLGTEGIAYLARLDRLAVDGVGWLNTLAVPVDADEPHMGAVLDALLDFSRLRAALKLEGGDLAALRSPGDQPQNQEPALIRATGWDQDSLKALLQHRELVAEDLGDVSVLRRVADAMTLASALGTSMDTLITAVTPDPGPEAVQLMQSALRARHGSGLLEVLKSVNDPLRSRRRDALVAYILRELRSRPGTAHIDTADKLFEFFLMDVRLEPCMRTSRVRSAISAVQLFIERALMNLDPDVPAAALNASRWNWMKRYRLWEANRQVFLWPENWLEPELRTDQSPAFRQALSELLQSDITEETATTALLGYLSRLEEVAKLEPCAIHYDEGDKDFGDEVAHVIARTAGAQRKYYYRRRATGTWTAWEQISLDIEDNPVAPVLWKGRLLLFWLKLMSTAPPVQPMTPGLAGTALTDLTIGQVQGEGTQNVKLFPQAALCWSEYYNGRWQPPKTSDITMPTGFGRPFDTSGEGAFHRDLLVLGETLESDALRIRIRGQGKGSSFMFYNTHSLPERQEDRSQDPLDVESFARFVRHIEPSSPTLRISYIGAEEGETARDVITVRDGTSYRVSSPFHISYFPDGDQQSLIQNPWEAPFLYSDSRHAFYVTTRRRTPPFADSPRFGLPRPEPIPQPIPRILTPLDTATDASLTFQIDSPRSVVHGDVEIAPTGRVGRPNSENRTRRPRHA
ncbi:neuraminidase-like domain-containing protein [Streptomyces sp. NBC_00887]|uniref:neuraminidase-like domain-containing protein n=1 Tax=Streptomyces sp. NBC_00887 TaxID=2975859 RepID=UPI00386F5D64|nr:neuraminidase-like domain-containing protein [Streptomyces sp. NBC_00887]